MDPQEKEVSAYSARARASPDSLTRRHQEYKQKWIQSKAELAKEAEA